MCIKTSNKPFNPFKLFKPFHPGRLESVINGTWTEHKPDELFLLCEDKSGDYCFYSVALFPYQREAPYWRCINCRYETILRLLLRVCLPAAAAHLRHSSPWFWSEEVRTSGWGGTQGIGMFSPPRNRSLNNPAPHGARASLSGSLLFIRLLFRIGGLSYCAYSPGSRWLCKWHVNEV